MTTHRVVSHDEWVAARKAHLADEKEFTRLRDRLSRERRELPWELVEEEYVFEGENGRRTLGEIFDGRGQLVVHHAMFNPETAGEDTTWTTDAACHACSFQMDNYDRVVVHLNHRDITVAAVSRAPYPKLAAYKERMGWTFPWYSSVGSDFNFDYGVSFTSEALQPSWLSSEADLDRAVRRSGDQQGALPGPLDQQERDGEQPDPGNEEETAVEQCEAQAHRPSRHVDACPKIGRAIAQARGHPEIR
jgi:predicted dithiol-disulfide oxidoreductase (DUF899 family)